MHLPREAKRVGVDIFFNCSVWAIQKTLVPDSHYFNVLEAAKTKYQKMMKQYATGIVTTAEMSR